MTGRRVRPFGPWSTRPESAGAPRVCGAGRRPPPPRIGTPEALSSAHASPSLDPDIRVTPRWCARTARPAPRARRVAPQRPRPPGDPPGGGPRDRRTPARKYAMENRRSALSSARGLPMHVPKCTHDVPCPAARLAFGTLGGPRVRRKTDVPCSHPNPLDHARSVDA